MKNINYKLVNYQDVMATMTITMSIRDWQSLGQQLQNGYPAWRLGRAISHLITRMSAELCEEIEVES